MPTNSSQKNNINLRPTATSFRPMAAAPSDPALKRIVQEQDGILEEIQNQLHATGDITIEMRTSMARQKGDIEAATEGVETTTEYLAELTKKAEKVEREANSNLFLFLIMIVDSRSILCTIVIPLAVQGSGVDAVPKDE